jgi:transposase
MSEWLPEDDLSKIVLDLVDHKFDLSKFYGKYHEDGLGAAFYDPKIMVGLILFSYCQGVRSSRQIERFCYWDVAYRIVARNHQPDHTTISRFCKSFTSELETLFYQFLKIVYENGMLNVGVMALDGTKMKANAAMRANRTLTPIEIEIKQMFKDSRRIDEEEDKIYGDKGNADIVPETLKTHKKRQELFEAAKKKMSEESARENQDYEERVKQREEEENENSDGKKLRGRKLKPPVPDSQRTTKINTTDPDSRIIKSYHNNYFQAFNAQIVVSQNQYIIAADVINEENDSNLLIPMVKQLEEQDCLPVSDSVLLTDAGYWGYLNYLAVCNSPLELLCAARKERKLSKIDGSSRFLLDLKNICSNVGTPFSNRTILASIATEFYHTFIANGIFPTPQSVAHGIMDARFTSESAKTLYSKRKTIVEPFFGWTKENRIF